MLGLLPAVVEQLTVPELLRLVQTRRRDRHFEAVRLALFLSYLGPAVAQGIAMAFNDRGSQPKTWKVMEVAATVPGYDPKLTSPRRRLER